MDTYQLATLIVSCLSLAGVVVAAFSAIASKQQVEIARQQADTAKIAAEVAKIAAEAARDAVSTATLQLDVAKKDLAMSALQIADDHERSRKEKAVLLLQHCDAHQTREQALARAVIEKLDGAQIAELVGQNRLKLPISMRTRVEGILSADISAQCVDGSMELSEAQTGEIRWRGVQYLNLLETVLTAWLHNVAERTILEDQFDYLYQTGTEDGAMLRFRRALGKGNYPAIEEFIKHITKKRNPGSPGLGPTGVV